MVYTYLPILFVTCFTLTNMLCNCQRFCLPTFVFSVCVYVLCWYYYLTHLVALLNMKSICGLVVSYLSLNKFTNNSFIPMIHVQVCPIEHTNHVDHIILAPDQTDVSVWLNKPIRHKCLLWYTIF